jgi:hypothetical protein
VRPWCLQLWSLPAVARFIVLDAGNESASTGCGGGASSCRAALGHFWGTCSGQILALAAATVPRRMSFPQSVAAQVGSEG